MLQAYGGDLKGNVWRFDLSDPDAAKWKAELIAKLKDASGKEQPITTGVRVEIDQNNNVDRYLFVGTGKLLGPNDLADTSVINTLYVIRDGTRTTPGPAPATPYSRAESQRRRREPRSPASRARRPAAAGTRTRPTRRRRSSPTSIADVQTVVYAFSKPPPDPCLVVLASTLYARDFAHGQFGAPIGGRRRRGERHRHRRRLPA